MNNQNISQDNRTFAGTRGISENNAGLGFVPAFKHTLTGQVEPARFRDGQPAPFHLIAWLPLSWAAETDASGCITRLVDGVIAGFEREGVFYTREQAAAL